MKIQIATVFGFDVQLPVRATEEAAGLDIYLPQYNEAFETEFYKMNESRTEAMGRIIKGPSENCIHVGPHARVILPTGLRVKIDRGTYLEVANRGSMAAKYGLVYGAHIIDSDYRGMVFINLINIGSKPQRIDFGQKIAQLLHKEVLMSEIELIDNDEYNRKRTSRGAGALGSTGR